MFSLISLGKIFLLLIQYKYAVFFPIMVVEGPIVTVIAGFLASLGYFNLFVLYAVSVAGDLTGDVIYYILGRWGGRRFIDKWGGYLKINFASIERFEKLFHRHAGKTLLLGKATHLIGGGILAAAGAAKFSFSRFLFFNTLATLPKSLILVMLGYYFGREYEKINKTFDYFVFAAVLLLFILVINFRKKLLNFFL